MSNIGLSVVGKFYSSVVRTTMLYGLECRAVKNKIGVWFCGNEVA